MLIKRFQLIRWLSKAYRSGKPAALKATWFLLFFSSFAQKKIKLNKSFNVMNVQNRYCWSWGNNNSIRFCLISEVQFLLLLLTTNLFILINLKWARIDFKIAKIIMKQMENETIFLFNHLATHSHDLNLTLEFHRDPLRKQKLFATRLNIFNNIDLASCNWSFATDFTLCTQWL